MSQSSDHPLVPAGWYPDPGGAPRMRWWTGSAWSDDYHVLAPSGPGPSASPPRRPRRRITRRTFTPAVMIAAAGAVLAIVATAVVGGVALSQRLAENEAAQPPTAEETVTAFLDALIAHDGEAADAFRTPQHRAARNGALDAEFVGDPTAAEWLNLEVEYEIAGIDYYETFLEDPPIDDSRADTATTAIVAVDLLYRFDAEGRRVEVRTRQAVRLERAFYYGDDQPRFYQTNQGRITARGPWAIRSLAEDFQLPSFPGVIGSDYAAAPVSANGSRYEVSCASPSGIARDIADIALRDARFPATCLAGGTTFAIPDDVSVAFIVDNVIPYAELEGVPELIGLSDIGGPEPPLRQYVLAVRDVHYVLTLALVDPTYAEDPAGIEYRVVALTRRSS